MEYSRYTPCLPKVQEDIVLEYQKSMGMVEPEKEKDKRRKKDKRR